MGVLLLKMTSGPKLEIQLTFLENFDFFPKTTHILYEFQFFLEFHRCLESSTVYGQKSFFLTLCTKILAFYCISKKQFSRKIAFLPFFKKSKSFVFFRAVWRGLVAYRIAQYHFSLTYDLSTSTLRERKVTKRSAWIIFL